MKPSTYICENGKHLGSINDNSVISCGEIINTTDSVLTNVTSTVTRSFFNKKVRYKMYCYILHTVLLVIMLLLINTICDKTMENIDLNKKNVLLY